jgi:leucyl-tRNA synthetase
MMPHLAEEIWELLGRTTLLADSPWPVADRALAEDDTVTIAVQVKGKLRATISMAKGAENSLVEETALKQPAVVKAIGDAPVRKVIIVPDRIVNVVI